MMRKKIVLALFGVFLAFATGEIIFKIIGYSAELYTLDRITGLVILRPNRTSMWVKDCFRNKVTANAVGFYDVEFVKEKPPNVFRIAVIGDSQVESLQVPLQKTWHKKLEAKLNERFGRRGKKIEIYSFGHSGNGQMLDYLYLKKYAVAYRPDLVIDLLFVENDFRDDSFALTQEYVRQTGDTGILAKFFPNVDEKGYIDIPASEAALESRIIPPKKSFAWARKILKKSSLMFALYQKFQTVRHSFKEQRPAQNGQATTLLATSDVPVDFQVLLKTYPRGWDIIWENEKRLIAAIDKTAHEYGAKFVLVSSGGAVRVETDNLTMDYLPQLDLDKPEQIIRAFTDEHGIPYLALTEPLRKKYFETKQEMMFACDVHWNETGHAWTANIIYDYLISRPQLITS